jgi:hypothetical protein
MADVILLLLRGLVSRETENPCRPPDPVSSPPPKPHWIGGIFSRIQSALVNRPA